MPNLLDRALTDYHNREAQRYQKAVDAARELLRQHLDVTASGDRLISGTPIVYADGLCFTVFERFPYPTEPSHYELRLVLQHPKNDFDISLTTFRSIADLGKYLATGSAAHDARTFAKLHFADLEAAADGANQ